MYLVGPFLKDLKIPFSNRKKGEKCFIGFQLCILFSFVLFNAKCLILEFVVIVTHGTGHIIMLKCVFDWVNNFTFNSGCFFSVFWLCLQFNNGFNGSDQDKHSDYSGNSHTANNFRQLKKTYRICLSYSKFRLLNIINLKILVMTNLVYMRTHMKYNIPK